MIILRHSLIFLGRALTIALGALPATYLCLLAFLVFLLGFDALLSGDVTGAIVMLWALAGFHGTVSLWAVGLGFVRGWSVAGLLLGTVALLPIGGHFLTGEVSMRLDRGPDSLMFVTPILVAVAWLCTLAVRSYCRPMFARLDHAEG